MCMKMTKEKIWEERGHGYTTEVDFPDGKRTYHLINSGKISKNKFINSVTKITGDSKTWLYEHVLLAGNDMKYLYPDDDYQIVMIKQFPSSINDVLLKFDLYGNLIWMRNDISEKDKKVIFEKYGELKQDG